MKRSNIVLQKFLSILGIILCLIFGFLLICNLTIIIKGAMHPESPPSVFGITPMVVKSGSMSGNQEGHIEAGDLIFIDKIEIEKLKKGDVIAFMDGASVVTHRIVDIEENENKELVFTTKGDANNAEDEKKVGEKQIVGVFSKRIAKIGDFVLFAQTPTGMFLFMGLPLLVFVSYDVMRRKKQTIEEAKKNEELQKEIEKLKKEKK
ncbi:signal peptidase I [Floccifex sp.]|uniref:signal peptidase I n=1 Tax=Floccifex sp. TaxID=2815810 RepID=UPI003F120471